MIHGLGLPRRKTAYGRDLPDPGAQRAAGRVEAATVRIRVSGNEAGAVGDEEGGPYASFPLKGRASFSDDDKIRVHHDR